MMKMVGWSDMTVSSKAEEELLLCSSGEKRIFAGFGVEPKMLPSVSTWLISRRRRKEKSSSHLAVFQLPPLGSRRRRIGQGKRTASCRELGGNIRLLKRNQSLTREGERQRETLRSLEFELGGLILLLATGKLFSSTLLSSFFTLLQVSARPSRQSPCTCKMR